MGRELKRVALDFDLPPGKPWQGYVNEAAGRMVDCAHCQDGWTPQAREVYDRWYGHARFRPEDRGSVAFTVHHRVVEARARGNVAASPDHYGSGESAVVREAMRLCEHYNTRWSHHLNQDDVDALVAAGRLMELTHDWTAQTGWVEKTPAVRPTPEQVNTWSLCGLGHDALNQHICVKAECERLGIQAICPHCQGEGKAWASQEDRLAAENWQRTEPPRGDGYQMWETVSEGRPISPVFSSALELARWLAGNRAGTVDEDTTVEEWMALIQGQGWAPSAVGIGGVVKTGSQACA